MDYLLQNTEVIALADASWDHISMYPDELAFRRGDVIAITDCSDGEWWIGFVDSPSGPVDSPSGPVDSPSGLFPPSCVRVHISQLKLYFMACKLVVLCCV